MTQFGLKSMAQMIGISDGTLRVWMEHEQLKNFQVPKTKPMEIKSNIYFYNALFDYVQKKKRGKNLRGVLSKIRYLKGIYGRV